MNARQGLAVVAVYGSVAILMVGGETAAGARPFSVTTATRGAGIASEQPSHAANRASVRTVAGFAAVNSPTSSTLNPAGVGRVRFRTRKTHAIAELTARFGRPTARGVNTACGPSFTEVEWDDLVVEFHSNQFSGYRYLVGGWRLPHQRPPRTVTPRLVTAAGISLRSTLGQLRSAYKTLRMVGADRWRAGNGLVFVDNAVRKPTSSSQIIEIKARACGDF